MDKDEAEAVLRTLGESLVWEPQTLLREHKARFVFWRRPRQRWGEFALFGRGQYNVFKQKKGRLCLYCVVYFPYAPNAPKAGFGPRGQLDPCPQEFTCLAEAKRACEQHALTRRWE